MASTPPRPTLPFAGTPHPQRRLREEGAPGQQSVWASLHSLLGQGEQRSLAGADPEDARVSFEGKKKETWKCKVNADQSRELRRPEPGGSGSMRRCPRGGGVSTGWGGFVQPSRLPAPSASFLAASSLASPSSPPLTMAAEVGGQGRNDSPGHSTEQEVRHGL